MKSTSLTLALCALLPLCAQAVTYTNIDNFDSVSSGSQWSSVSGWSYVPGVTSNNNGLITSGAGYGDNNGGTMSERDGYMLSLGSNSKTAADGPISLKFDFRGSSINNYMFAQVLIGQTGGINGLVVQFNGGTNNSDTDNFVQVSGGNGTSWGGADIINISNSAWNAGHWYEVTINMALSDTLPGNQLTASLSIYDLTNSNYLIENLLIKGTGASGGAFDTLNMLQVKNNGSAREFDISNIRIASIPESGTTASLLAISMIAGVLLLRRLRK